MNADQVRATVAAQFPGVLKSQAAVACATFSAADEADCAVQFASMRSRLDVSAIKRLHADALDYAAGCLRACDGWTVETLGHNIQSQMQGDLDDDECDAIARRVLGL